MRLYETQVADMAAAVHYVNSLPGRYCGGLFGELVSDLHS